jgi:DnaJ-class molecular chaperone
MPATPREVEVFDVCDECDGDGGFVYDDGFGEECDVCHGEGMVTHASQLPWCKHGVNENAPCGDCTTDKYGENVVF